MDAPASFYSQRNLCGLRLENNAPFASIQRGLPALCFLDVILAPLATWVLLVLIGALWVPALLKSRRHVASFKLPLQRYRFRSTYAGVAAPRFPRLATALAVLHTLLVIAALLMNVLEIVRLYLAHRGAGLLPFTLGGIVLVLLLMHVRTHLRVRSVTAFVVLAFWLLSAAFTAVKIAKLAKLENVEPRIGGYEDEYHTADQIIDTAVYLGLYAIFLVIELVRLPAVLKEARSVHSEDAYGRRASEETPLEKAAQPAA
ncbi:hypothetical protein FA09DRAFT_323122 [Tilletiopsis washingtonensis]|uniref:Uncharacterized protein n=1 Tax=Tilletiopsis washingtonensis TaxID=58919 RepID=A0A316YZX7_9BASI|nr:hypothetical protein FA09DRAFT_323122 [Tilletiopsis washingtonensis]PWN95010.1 hypothetical protein FA09DRAFT_323122 [Tilletiopsis washingtonensis]